MIRLTTLDDLRKKISEIEGSSKEPSADKKPSAYRKPSADKTNSTFSDHPQATLHQNNGVKSAQGLQDVTKTSENDSRSLLQRDLDNVASAASDSIKKTQKKAIQLLSRRDHSRGELAGKLADELLSVDDLNRVLDELSEQNLLCDMRFADMFVRSRLNRGQGEQRIRQELRNKQVASHFIDEAFSAHSIDWSYQANEQLAKKFDRIKRLKLQEIEECGEMIPYAELQKLRAKSMRFLQQRGFSGDVISDIVYKYWVFNTE